MKWTTSLGCTLPEYLSSSLQSRLYYHHTGVAIRKLLRTGQNFRTRLRCTGFFHGNRQLHALHGVLTGTSVALDSPILYPDREVVATQMTKAVSYGLESSTCRGVSLPSIASCWYIHSSFTSVSASDTAKLKPTVITYNPAEPGAAAWHPCDSSFT